MTKSSSSPFPLGFVDQVVVFPATIPVEAGVELVSWLLEDAVSTLVLEAFSRSDELSFSLELSFS